jgi:hypothetical protein
MHKGMAHSQGMMHSGHRGQMMENHKVMNDQYQEMMSKMKTTDQELQSLVQKMKAASQQDQKIEVMENLLTKMVENRTMLNERMMSMMPQMMQHMSRHMHMSQSGQSSMMDQPMMDHMNQKP